MRLLLISLTALLVLIQYPLWLGKGGWLRVWDLSRQLDVALVKEQELQARNSKLASEVQDLKEGTGANPTVNDTVVAHYRGTLADGKEFDSSYKRGEPAAFPLTRVVPCWTQGMQKIRVGGKARLTCPSATAYGDRGYPGLIPGGAVLTFEVELVSIKK